MLLYRNQANERRNGGFDESETLQFPLRTRGRRDGKRWEEMGRVDAVFSENEQVVVDRSQQAIRRFF